MLCPRQIEEARWVEGELKGTKSRDNALPLDKSVLEVLRLWRGHTPYRGEEDWIVKVTQSQLRHTTPKITLESYAQVVSDDQKKAHQKVVQMVVPKRLSAKLKAREAASNN